jgi:predicted dehydrogenase
MISTVSYGYLPGLRLISDRVEVAAIADLVRPRAEAVAHDWDIPRVCDDLAEMLKDDGLDAVLNLTPSAAHYENSMKILEAGKHLVTDKPLATSLAEADAICELAQEKRLLVVCAPDDMLKREWREAKRLVRAGAIGQVAFARAQSSHAGPAAYSWPADPTWFYQKGAGSLLDLGVYGIHRVTGLLGPAQRVTAMSGIVAPKRKARGGKFDGLEILVTEDDNTLVMLDFGNSVFAVVDGTFNVVATKSAEMEIFGLEGTMAVNRADAEVAPGQLPIELYRTDAAPGLAGWVTPRTLAPPTPWEVRAQGLFRAALVEHLVDCLDNGGQPVVGALHGRHVLEIMLTARQAAREGRTLSLTTTFPS